MIIIDVLEVSFVKSEVRSTSVIYAVRDDECRWTPINAKYTSSHVKKTVNMVIDNDVLS